LAIGKEEEEEAASSKRGMGGPPVSSRRVGILPTSSLERIITYKPLFLRKKTEDERRRFFNSSSMNGPLGNAFAALAAKLNNREADLAWPERSKGTWVPA
jgi:hypothetical protein